MPWHTMVSVGAGAGVPVATFIITQETGRSSRILELLGSLSGTRWDLEGCSRMFKSCFTCSAYIKKGRYTYIHAI